MAATEPGEAGPRRLGKSAIRRFLIDAVASRCRVPSSEVDPDQPLDEFGLTSRDAVAIAGELERLIGARLPATLVYEHPTIARITDAIAHGEFSAPGSDNTNRPDSATTDSGEPIAVVGIGCRFPGGVSGPAAYWRFLLDRGDAIREVPDGRWDAFDDGSLEDVTRLGGFLEDIAGFDSRFFGITPDEADVMDPQQRLLLEVAWEAFQHAGVAPPSLRGSRTGVFVGVSAPEYGYVTGTAPLRPWTATGAALSIVANRLSYLLDLRGPSMIVDTACSSSLVATHLAVRSLHDGESDLAVAAGVNVLLSPLITKTFDLSGATAPDGRCKPFDASGDGMVRAEGCGVIILKRLSDARRDGDRVLALIRNSAVNSDGRSNGLVAPNAEAQAAVVRSAYAGLPRPDYVEAHGTGTFLGDPIEARALATALRALNTAGPDAAGLDRDGSGAPGPNGNRSDENGPETHGLGGGGQEADGLSADRRGGSGAAHLGGRGSNQIDLNRVDPNGDGSGWNGPETIALDGDGPEADVLGGGGSGADGSCADGSCTDSSGADGLGGGGSGADVLGGRGREAGGRPVVIGSVKSNLGHLEAAAGVAGLIKVVLALAHRRIPPSLHYREPNPHIDFPELGLAVAADETPWPETGRPALAGVSGFGFGGTNAHVVLEEAPVAEDRPRPRRGPAVHTLLLSDVEADRIGPYAARLADWLETAPDSALPDVAHTLIRRFGRGRAAAAVVGRDRAGLAEALRAPRVTGVTIGRDARPVWVFSGYGAQRPSMGRRLLAEEPAFATAIDALDGPFAAEAGFSLWDTLESGERVTGVYRTMTTLFGLQVGLAALLRSYGAEPGAVIGHSMGEVAAAVAGGALSLADGVKVITTRARLLDGIAETGAGAMLVLGCSAVDALGLVRDGSDVHVAVRSSPQQTVLTGDADELARVADRATDEGLLARLVQAEGAGHSPAVDPILDPLRAELAHVRGGVADVPFYSTVLEDPREAPAFDGDYWAGGVRRTVRLADAVAAAAEDGFTTFVEVNAHPLLAQAITETADGALVVPTLRRPPRRSGRPEADDTVTFHEALATLTVHGHLPAPTPPGRVVDVPVPAWEHRHHWIDAPARGAAGQHPLLGAHVELPGEDRHAWSSDVGTAASPWADRPFGQPLLPTAAYAEIALAAGAAALGPDVAVTGLRLHRFLPLEEHTTVTTSLTISHDEAAVVDVHARTAAGTWTRLASATVAPAGSPPADAPPTGATPADAIPTSGPPVSPASVSGASVSGVGVSGPAASGASVSGAAASDVPVGGAAADGPSANGAPVSGPLVDRAAVSGAPVSGAAAPSADGPSANGAPVSGPSVDRESMSSALVIGPAANGASAIESSVSGPLVDGIGVDGTGVDAEVEIGPAEEGNRHFRLHPEVFGRCLAALADLLDGGAPATDPAQPVWLPESIGTVRVYGPTRNGGRCLIRLTSTSDGRTADLRLVGEAGRVLLEATDIRLRTYGRTELPVPLSTKLAEVVWEPTGAASAADGDPFADAVAVAASGGRAAGESGAGAASVVDGHVFADAVVAVASGGRAAAEPGAEAAPVVDGHLFADVVVLAGPGDPVAGELPAGVVRAIDDWTAVEQWARGFVTTGAGTAADGVSSHVAVESATGHPAVESVTDHPVVESVTDRPAVESATDHPASEGAVGHAVNEDAAGRPASADSAGGPAQVVVLVPGDLVGERLVLAVSGLVRGLTSGSAPPRLWLVTRGALRPAGTGAGEPGQAFVGAMVRVLGFETPALRATHLDLDANGPASMAAEQIAVELRACPADTEIARRGGARYVARLAAARVGDGHDPKPESAGRTAGDRSPGRTAGDRLPGRTAGDRPLGRTAGHRLRPVVRRGAAYVISGGYGGLGLVTARLLAERGAGRIVLSGRSGPPPDAEKAISELRESGVEVEVVLGDIAAPGVAERMVAAGGDRLRGVVHAAGGLADRIFTDIDVADLRRVWAPKVDGAYRLYEAARGHDLDWWVAYSSAAALLGSPGQGAYAAANAAVDAFTGFLREQGVPAVTINWGTWSRVGGAANLTGGPVGGIDPITPDEGAEAFEALLAHDRAATGVLRFDPRQAVTAFPELGRMPYFSALVGALPEVADDWPGPEALRSLEPAAARTLVRDRVAERVATVLGFRPDPAQSLTDLGLDSLVAVRIKSALEHDFGLTVPATVLLQGGSVEVLTTWALTELGLADPERGEEADGRASGATSRSDGKTLGTASHPDGKTLGAASRSDGKSPAVTSRIEGGTPEAASRPDGRAPGTASRPDVGAPGSASRLGGRTPGAAGRPEDRAARAARNRPEGGAFVDARDASERLVVRVFERVLGAHGVSATDDFFTLGGREDQARTVLEILELEVGRPIDHAEVFAHPTVEHLASVIRKGEEEAARRIVRSLSSATRGRPFFCVHPAGGTTGVYRQLATLVGGPFLGLERFADAPSVEERAARYAALIRETQRQGPYRLGGWSFGGVVAYETARILGDVELLALIDAGIPRQVDDATEAAARRYADFVAYLNETYGLGVALSLEELRPLDEDAQLALVMERAASLMETLPPAVLHHQLTSHEDTRSLEAYRPEPYDGRVVLYRATEPTPWTVRDARYELDETNGFGGLCPRLEVVPIRGAHHLNLLDPPAVHALAGHLGALLTGR